MSEAVVNSLTCPSVCLKQFMNPNGVKLNMINELDHFDSNCITCLHLKDDVSKMQYCEYKYFGFMTLE